MSVNTTSLITDPDVLDRLEKDLIQKAVDALTAAEVASVVYGVFSLDELERKQAEELEGRMAVGVGYQGCKAMTLKDNAAQGNTAVGTEFFFLVMFAVPVDEVLSQRRTASQILSILRRGIVGSPIVDSARTQRTWTFVQEKPEVEDSTETMLYYTQVWRIVLPTKGN